MGPFEGLIEWVWGLRRDCEADEGTDAFALKRILSPREKARLETLTAAFTSAVRSAQIDPPHKSPQFEPWSQRSAG